MIQSALTVGSTLKGADVYTIAEPLHSGGFGITYRATAQMMVGNIPQTITFTIKEFFMSKICSRDADGNVVVAKENQQIFKHAKADFKSEAKILHSLKHKNIVPVNEVFEQNNTVYYVMGYLGKMSLYQYVAENGGLLQEQQAKDIILHLSGALVYLHNHNILHLDIKPDNIMMVKHGDTVKPVLIDFGQALYFINGKPQKDKGIMGYSKGYSSSEMKQKVVSFSPSLDVYSLAATLLYMLSGKDPCDAEELNISKVYRSLPESISQITIDAIVVGLQKDANNCPKDIVGFQNLLIHGKQLIGNSSFTNNSRGIATTPIIHNDKKRLPIVKILISIASVMTILIVGWFVWSKLQNGGKINRQQSSSNATGQLLIGDSITIPVKDGISIDMVRVEAGTFTMGATPEMKDPYDDEKPTHQVTLTNDYYIGKYEVTQALWKAVMGNNPSKFNGDNLPVEQVSWDDCQEFINKLNRITGKTFRLPTEAEWEYAARGGKKSRGYQYSGSDNPSDVAWYEDNSSSKTHVVGTKQANELGIYDMSGNVFEWCQDWEGSYSSSSQVNPTGANSGSNRVFRGGSWFYTARICRSSCRSFNSPGHRFFNLGFRLVLSE